MDRRRFLRATGVATAVGLAGCAGNDSDGDGGDGAANEYGYETTTNDGVAVPLVPVADAVEWYEDDDVVFVDARDRTAYESARVAEALLSPAPDGLDDDDPVGDLPTDTRLVTYCVCPHHLATLRGASLIRDEYVHTYALDEGFEPWIEAGHPVAGSSLQDRPAIHRIDGRTDATVADELAWARHEPTGQREAVPIDDDGSFSLHLRFHDVDLQSRIAVETPAGRTDGALEELVEEGVEL